MGPFAAKQRPSLAARDLALNLVEEFLGVRVNLLELRLTRLLVELDDVANLREGVEEPVGGENRLGLVEVIPHLHDAPLPLAAAPGKLALEVAGLKGRQEEPRTQLELLRQVVLHPL